MVALPAGMEKLCQLMTEWLVPAPLVVMTLSLLGAGVLVLICPWTATPPCGLANESGDTVLNAVASAKVNWRA